MLGLGSLGRRLKAAAGAFSTGGYNAATGGRRVIHMGSTTRGVNSLALSDGPQLLARARKAAMDTDLAVAGIAAFVAEVIGTGRPPHFKHPDPVTRQKLQREWNLWVPQASATRKIGPDGKPDSFQSFYGQQALVCRNAVEAGEAFARLRPRLVSDLSPTGLRVPLQIELIEPEQLAFWRQSGEMASPLNIMRGSIEFDAIRQRVAYHFYRDHPGDSTVWPNAYEVVPVPAQSVLHVIEFIRGNQIRGITPLASILIQMADLDDYDDAERLRQKLGAYMFAWKETTTPDDDDNHSRSTTSAGTDQADAGTAYVESAPGQLTMIDVGAQEKMGFYAHPGTPQGYAVFMREQQQKIATILRVAYDMATGNTDGSNYSRSRIRLIALRRMWEQYQQNVIEHQFCRPVVRAWLDAAALAGVIDAGDYLRNPDLYLDIEWLSQPWDWVDPEADVKSVRMEIESALTSREAEVAKRGRNVEDVDAEISRDHEREAELGIQPVYGASRVNIDANPGDNPDEEPAPVPQEAK